MIGTQEASRNTSAPNLPIQPVPGRNRNRRILSSPVELLSLSLLFHRRVSGDASSHPHTGRIFPLAGQRYWHRCGTLPESGLYQRYRSAGGLLGREMPFPADSNRNADAHRRLESTILQAFVSSSLQGGPPLSNNATRYQSFRPLLESRAETLLYNGIARSNGDGAGTQLWPGTINFDNRAFGIFRERPILGKIRAGRITWWLLPSGRIETGERRVLKCRDKGNGWNGKRLFRRGRWKSWLSGFNKWKITSEISRYCLPSISVLGWWYRCLKEVCKNLFPQWTLVYFNFIFRGDVCLSVLRVLFYFTLLRSFSLLIATDLWYKTQKWSMRGIYIILC